MKEPHGEGVANHPGPESRGVAPPGRDAPPERGEKARGRRASMDGQGKSDSPVVPKKPPHNADGPAPQAAEVVEGRGLAKGNSIEHNTLRTPSREAGVPSALERVREAAKRDQRAPCTPGPACASPP